MKSGTLPSSTRLACRVTLIERQSPFTVFVRLEFTAYEDGRRLEPYSEEIPSEPKDLTAERYFQVLNGIAPILYEGESTPLLQAGSFKDIRQRVLSRSVPTIARWEVVFPTLISDRIEHAQVEINQESGIIKLTIPESDQVFKESKYSSDLNLLKYLPACTSHTTSSLQDITLTRRLGAFLKACVTSVN